MIDKLEEAIRKNEGDVADDQLAYLKTKSQDKKEVARENRMMAAMGLKSGNKSTDQEFRLREKWDAHPVTKASSSMGDHFSRINAVDATKPAGQMSMIFAYMKMLDDGSVVRESEYAQAARTAGMLDRAENYMQQIKSGKILNPQQITEFRDSANQIMGEVAKKQHRLDSETEDLAQGYGLDPKKVVYRDVMGTGKTSSATPGSKGAILSPDEFFAQKNKGTM